MERLLQDRFFILDNEAGMYLDKSDKFEADSPMKEAAYSSDSKDAASAKMTALNLAAPRYSVTRTKRPVKS